MEWLPSLGRAFLFLGVPMVLMFFWLQWRWSKICSDNLQLLIIKSDGSSRFELALKSGNSVT